MKAEDLEKTVKNMSFTEKLEANGLAGKFYELHGYESKGIDFAASGHPQERLVYAMAVAAFAHFKGRGDRLDDFMEELEDSFPGFEDNDHVPAAELVDFVAQKHLEYRSQSKEEDSGEV